MLSAIRFVRRMLACLLALCCLWGVMPTAMPVAMATEQVELPAASDTDQEAKSVDPTLWGIEMRADRTLRVHAYYGSETDLTVPDTLLGMPVTEVELDSVYPRAEDAFSQSDPLFTLILPPSINSVLGNLSANCTQLTVRGDIASVPNGFSLHYGNLDSVIFEGNVGTIGEYAFNGNEKLTSVVFHGSVEAIGESAFSGCSGLTEMALPNGLVSIGRYAFGDCDGIVQIVLPEGVISIGDSAFSDCESLKSVSLPSTLESIGANGFQSCEALTEVVCLSPKVTLGEHVFLNTKAKLPSTTATTAVISDHFAEASYADGWGYRACSGGIRLISVPDEYRQPPQNGETLEVVIPAELDGQPVRELGFSLLDSNEAVSSIVVPESVTTIGDYAFSYCKALTQVTLPEGLTDIGSGAFANCEALTAITLPEGLTTIGNFAFGNCTALKEITIPEGVTVLSDTLFSGCSSLREVNLPQGLTTIGANAFSDCTALRSVSLPDSLTELGDGAFSSCDSLEKIVLPNGIARIPYWCFGSCSALTSVTLPESLTEICEYAFIYCDALSSISLPEGLVTIGAYAFGDCERLRKLSLPGSLVSVARGAFSNTGISSLKLPDGMVIVPEMLLEECSNLSEIQLSPNTLYLGRRCLAVTYQLSSLEVPEGTQVLAYEALSEAGMRNLTLPSTLTHLGSLALNRIGRTGNSMEWLMLRKLTMNSMTCDIALDFLSDVPEAYLYEGQEAFGRSMTLVCEPNSTIDVLLANSKCIKKEYLPLSTFPEIIAPADPVLSADLFAGRNDVSSIIIPEGVVAIEEGAFKNCRRLVSVSLPSTLTSIGVGAFMNCRNLSSVVLPDSVTSLGETAFSFNTSLKEITIPAGVTDLPMGVFTGNTSMSQVTLPEGLKTIGSLAFAFCGSEEAPLHINLPSSLTEIDDSAFLWSNFVEATVTAGSYAEEYAQTNKFEISDPE